MWILSGVAYGKPTKSMPKYNLGYSNSFLSNNIEGSRPRPHVGSLYFG
jgi:hypothetical protein